MKINIKIHRERKNDNSFHNGIIEFENGLQIPFQVSDDKLKEIHYEQLLKDSQLANGQNVYQATFELTSD
ncbi:hypothetical protein GCM10009118_27000 [Wandonia haliotis]|uniref:Uncharacterized protein n=1 Tax=Wandonia haliotis TaxID=574963 RepID=A0ABN1MSP3_9FLAO